MDETQAAKVGQLAGAKILVVGRAFIIDEEMVIVAKVIATETGIVKAEVVKGALAEKLGTIADKISKRVHKVISEEGLSMIARADVVSPEDRLEFLKLKMKGKQLPKVSVSIVERHFGGVSIDPAAETEVIYYLKKAGFTVLSQKGDVLADWAKEYFKNADVEIPQKIEKVDVLLIGEAFSEFALRRGNLVSCKARVELRAIDRRTGRILAIERGTSAAVDLSEQIAGKKALQEVAATIAYRIIPEMVDNWHGKPRTIAVMEFSNLAGDKKLIEWGKDYARDLSLTLAQDDRYTIVEREQIDKIIEEIELNRSGYVNPAEAIKIGKLLGAQIMVLGLTFQVDSRIRVDVHLVEPKTGKILKAQVVEGDKANLKELKQRLNTAITRDLLELATRKTGESK